ncbi:MAG TPA: hypothetical protein DIC42_06965 [Holosporales bacterium]|nr:hypothetical protein [Holosporales bacterium]
MKNINKMAISMIALIAVTHATEEPPVPTEQTSQQLANQQTDPIRLGLEEWVHNLRERIAELTLENDEENARQRENDRLYGRSRDNYQDKVRKQDRMDRLRNAKRDLYEAEEALRKFDQAAQSRQHP